MAVTEEPPVDCAAAGHPDTEELDEFTGRCRDCGAHLTLADRAASCARCGRLWAVEAPWSTTRWETCEACKQRYVHYPDGRIVPVWEPEAARDARALADRGGDRLDARNAAKPYDGSEAGRQRLMRAIRAHHDADTREMLAANGAPRETWADLPTHDDADAASADAERGRP